MEVKIIFVLYFTFVFVSKHGKETVLNNRLYSMKCGGDVVKMRTNNIFFHQGKLYVVFNFLQGYILSNTFIRVCSPNMR